MKWSLRAWTARREAVPLSVSTLSLLGQLRTSKGPVYFSPVMNGCFAACCGDHLLIGSRFKRPSTKLMKARRWPISEGKLVKVFLACAPLSTSDGFAFFFVYGYSMTMSGSFVCLKYCLLGCSLVRCSLEYCSMGLSLCCLRPCASTPTKLKNSFVCLPISSKCCGGNLSCELERVVIADLPKHVHDSRNLVVLARSGEDGETEEQLDDDAAKGPHVDGRRVRQSEKNLWGAVESGLDICVHSLEFMAC